MSGDISRRRFDPHLAFRGVQLQQGRVSLDADFNELDELLDRRSRAHTHDTIGPAVVPATTPDGFKLTVVGGEIQIGRGRAYVDGILAECFGHDSGTLTFDANLEQDFYDAPLPLSKQPFFYGTGFPVPGPANGDTNIAYLDVWTREVTVDQQPDLLLEPALGGAETTTRTQTAWQVKFLDVNAGTTCADTPAEWTDLIRPSTTRLTTSHVQVVPNPDPCVIDPAGGYTGLENRTYRVEVHSGGKLGDAVPPTFVWSRDNASLTASIKTITPPPSAGTDSVLTVSSTGRDSWKRFETGQTIELLDDHIEFARRDRDTGGLLLTITNVVHATGQIHVSQDLTSYLTTAGPHPRVVRWDTDPANPTMTAERNAGPGLKLGLEEGIEVTFEGSTTDTLRAGDYWVFVARTANGSVEELQSQPPRGIHHHFQRLGIYLVGGTDVEDCRIPWPPDCSCDGEGCDCDQCVTPESHNSGTLTIQDAIDAVIAAKGGTVCLKAGRYLLKKALIIHGGVSVHLRGQGLRTQIILRMGRGPMLLVEESLDVSVRALSLVAESRSAANDNANVVEVVNAFRVLLSDLYLVADTVGMLGKISAASAGKGGLAQRGTAIALAGLVVDLDVDRCVLVAGVGVAGPARVSSKVVNAKVGPWLVAATVAVTDCWIIAGHVGVQLGGLDESKTIAIAFDHITVQGNTVYGPDDAGIRLALVSKASSTRVTDNLIDSSGTGVVVATDNTTVDGNTIRAHGERRPDAVVLASGGRPLLSGTRLLGNDVEASGAGVLVETRVQHVTVDGNRLTSCGNGIVMNLEAAADDLQVTTNQVLDTTLSEGARPGAGIALVRANDAVVADNLVRSVRGTNGADPPFGIVALTCPRVRISGNTVERVGEDQEGEAVGIASLGRFRELDVVTNFVQQTLEGERKGEAWYALQIGEIREIGIGDIQVVEDDDKVFGLGAAAVNVDLKVRGRAGVNGNSFFTQGDSPSVHVRGEISLLFGDNRVVAAGEPDIEVLLELMTLALTANHVEGPRERLGVVAEVLGGAMDAGGSAVAAFTGVGNLTTGEIRLNNAPLPSPWDLLNVRLT
jgi:hypothetical protein